jgi:hypothetical protein
MPGAETPAHATLKKLALQWAQLQRYPICGIEVRLPHSNYRADAVAYRPATERLPSPGNGKAAQRLVRQAVVGTTAVFECKQARSDFLKDSHTTVETTQKLKALDERRRTLERLLGMHQPSLRKGESLFAEYDAIDISNFEHKTYRKVIREISILQARLYGKTKFDKVARYCCANLCYLVVEDGILKSHEVPLHWGLLVRQGDALMLVRMPVWRDVSVPTRLELLQRIALTGTRRLNPASGLSGNHSVDERAKLLPA